MENQIKEDGSVNTYRRRDLFKSADEFCKAYGGGISIGEELQYFADMRNARGQDYWIGYEIKDSRGEECGVISAGYIGFSPDINLYAEIAIDNEVLESEAQSMSNISPHNNV